MYTTFVLVKNCSKIVPWFFPFIQKGFPNKYFGVLYFSIFIFSCDTVHIYILFIYTLLFTYTVLFTHMVTIHSTSSVVVHALDKNKSVANYFSSAIQSA